MGYGTTIGKCKTCSKIKAIGDMAICRECCLEKVKETELVCKSCLHDDGSTWSPESKHEAECRECGESRLVDEELLCKNCHDREHIKKMKQRDMVAKRCHNCQNNFLSNNYNQHICNNCLSNCYGCRGKFEPENRLDIFCAECKGRMDEGQCTACYNYADNVDERGHCYNCSTPIGKSFCVVCNVNEVSKEGELCTMCEGKEKRCPRCLDTKISVVEFICQTCKDNE